MWKIEKDKDKTWKDNICTAPEIFANRKIKGFMVFNNMFSNLVSISIKSFPGGG